MKSQSLYILSSKNIFKESKVAKVEKTTSIYLVNAISLPGASYEILDEGISRELLGKK